jgi:hypothetical protein
MHPAALPLDQLLADCIVERTRRGGPGGQHRNKVETAVVVTHRPTGVQAEASERRSQAENHAVALQRLRVQLALSVRAPLSEESPSRLWKSRIAGGRVAVNPEHADAPALLAEALDVLAAAEWQVPEAAAGLGTSSSQLVKFLKQQAALPQLNSRRRDLGLSPLR